MKKILFAVISAITVFGCKTDFPVNAPYKPIMVIYGLLNANADTQFVRIQKAFQNENIDALIVAGNADSIYYDDRLQVFLLSNLNKTDSIFLKRTIIPKS